MPCALVLDFASEHSFCVTLETVQLSVQLVHSSVAEETIHALFDNQHTGFIVFYLKLLWKKFMQLNQFCSVADRIKFLFGQGKLASI